jgi:hypothetical protein
VRDTYTAIIDAAVGDEEIPDRMAVIDTLGHVVNSVILEWMNGWRDVAAVQTILDDAVHVLLRSSGS